MTEQVLTIEMDAATTPRNAARIEFYTQLRREQFGKYLHQIAARIIAERTAGKNNTKNKESENK